MEFFDTIIPGENKRVELVAEIFLKHQLKGTYVGYICLK
jgi:hypothetical protein